MTSVLPMIATHTKKHGNMMEEMEKLLSVDVGLASVSSPTQVTVD